MNPLDNLTLPGAQRSLDKKTAEVVRAILFEIPETHEAHKALLKALSDLMTEMTRKPNYEGYDLVSACVDEALGAMESCYLVLPRGLAA